MSKNPKLTDSEFKKYKKIDKETFNETFALGEVQFLIEDAQRNLERLKEERSEINKRLKSLQSEYQDFVKKLALKYGDNFVIDNETGEVLNAK